MKVDVQEAKERFSEMLDLITIGEKVIITCKGEPVAKLVSIPAAKKRGRFRLGSAKGEFTVPE
jgi:prevent-host-death family protein